MYSMECFCWSIDGHTYSMGAYNITSGALGFYSIPSWHYLLLTHTIVILTIKYMYIHTVSNTIYNVSYQQQIISILVHIKLIPTSDYYPAGHFAN